MQIRDRIDIPMDELEALCRRYHVRELALFGSVLRDDFRGLHRLDTIGSDWEARLLAIPRWPRSVAHYSGR